MLTEFNKVSNWDFSILQYVSFCLPLWGLTLAYVILPMLLTNSWSEPEFPHAGHSVLKHLYLTKVFT